MRARSSRIIISALSLCCAGAIMAQGTVPSKEGTRRVKIGFLVKQPEEPWFQNEWKFADMAGADFGFDVVKIGATDGEKVLNGIESLAAQGAEGFVICAPDVLLGQAIMARARVHSMKVFSVDDRLVDSRGNPIEGVPHMGISSSAIGKTVGLTLRARMRELGWSDADTGAISISYYGLATAKERNEAVIRALSGAGFPRNRVFDSPQRFPLDVESGFNAALTTLAKHPEIPHWLIFGINDETVLGGVRATESRGLSKDEVVAVGIGGQGTALVEFRKQKETAFYATVAISSKRHGYEVAEQLWRWIALGEEPPDQIYTEGRLMTRGSMREIVASMGLED